MADSAEVALLNQALSKGMSISLHNGKVFHAVQPTNSAQVGTLGFMSSYRNRPAIRPWHWITLILVTACALSLPIAVNAVLPDKQKQGIPVDLGINSLEGEWSLPLTDANGADVLCKKDASLPLIGGFDCGGTMVVPYVHENGVDPDTTLRRMVRATGNLEQLDQYPITKQGPLSIIEVAGTWPGIGMSIQGTGDHEGLSMFVYVEGPDDYYYAHLVADVLLQEAGVAKSDAEEFELAA